jgi:hypothetical protein
LTCPHCQSQLKYRERAGKVCSRCNRRFAFDPRVDPLKLTDARFRHFVEHFSHNGQIAYTAEQLRVALSRNYRQRSDARRPVAGRPSPPWYELRDGQLWLGALVLLGPLLACGAYGYWQVGLLLGLFGLVWVVGLHLHNSHKQHQRYAAQVALVQRQQAAYDQTKQHTRITLLLTPPMLQRMLRLWREVYGEAPPGLILEGLQAPPQAPLLDGLCAVLACADREVLRCLVFNRLEGQLGLGLIPTEPPFDARHEALLALLRARPELPLLLLRDASPAGCLLATSLRQQLGLDAAHPFVDLGITPQQALTQRLMDVTAPVTTATLDALRGQLAAGRLNAAEFDWLERGFYSPLVAVPPATLLVRVAEAVADIEARERSVAGLRPAEVGFMTWPQ